MTECWVLAAVEVLLQKTVGLGIFCKIYGRNAGVRGWKKWGLLIVLLLFCLEDIRLTNSTIINTSQVIMNMLSEGLWLWLWTRERVSRIICWCGFYSWFYAIIKLPSLLLCGILYGGDLGDVNYGRYLVGILLKTGIVLILFVLIWIWREKIVSLLKKMLDQWGGSLLLIGLVENILTIYIMNLVWDRFYLQVLVLNLIVLVSLFTVMILLFFVLEYCAMKKESQMIYSKERMLEENYNFLKQEIERNSKINHDHKYDFRYLYDCFLEKDWEAGRAYIEPKLEDYRKKQGSEVWTGCKCIDFLIDSAKARAEEKNIAFQMDIAAVEIPIAEYDFFTVLGNLLDNAIEAAEKCEGQGRYVAFRLRTINDMLTLSLENGYEEEPRIKKGRFLSSKEDAAGHGWGLKNAREIVEKYEGMFQVSYGKQVFRVDITLS